MAKRWENMSDAEKQEILEQVDFQIFLEETADLEFQAFIEETDTFDLKQYWLERFVHRRKYAVC